MQRYSLVFLLMFWIVPNSTAQLGTRNYDVVAAGAASRPTEFTTYSVAGDYDCVLTI
jgi:hypothetical protein